MRVNFHFLIRSELALFPRGVHLEIESLILDLVEFSFSLKFCNFYVGPTLLTNSNNPVLSPLHFFFSKNFLPLSSLLFSLPLTLSLKKLIPTKFCSSFFYISSRSKSSIGEANSEHNLGRSVFSLSLSLSLSVKPPWLIGLHDSGFLDHVANSNARQVGPRHLQIKPPWQWVFEVSGVAVEWWVLGFLFF